MRPAARAIACLGLAAAAAGAEPAAPTDPLLGSLLGSWSGAYVCNQGLTGLTLSITRTEPDIRAVFIFYAVSANPGVPDGCFEMTGRLDADNGALDFVAGRWIYRPLDYVTVDLEGRLDPGTGVYSGVVHGYNCTNFELTRTDAPPAPAHVCRQPDDVAARR